MVKAINTLNKASKEKLKLAVIDYALERECIKVILEYIAEVVEHKPELAIKQLKKLSNYIEEEKPLENFIDEIGME